jgi:hypothetical protein
MAQWLNKEQVLVGRRVQDAKASSGKMVHTSARVQFTSRAYVIRKRHYGMCFLNLLFNPVEVNMFLYNFNQT